MDKKNYPPGPGMLPEAGGNVKYSFYNCLTDCTAFVHRISGRTTTVRSRSLKICFCVSTRSYGHFHICRLNIAIRSLLGDGNTTCITACIICPISLTSQIDIMQVGFGVRVVHP